MKKIIRRTLSSQRGIRVVALGGGTGLSALLRGLKLHVVPRHDPFPTVKRPIVDLAAIVTVTDDGGSSGRLRRENRILPPGDIRNCMVALSKDEALLSRLFQYRFSAGRGLAGHNFGNLFLAALTHVTGDFAEAVRVSSRVLAIRGRIFPSTVSNVTLKAVLENGQRVHGETRITASRSPILKLMLAPPNVRPLPEAVEAIREADLYIANLMTQPGETTNYSVAEHLRAIQTHVKPRIVDYVVANRQNVSLEVARRYRREGASQVKVDIGGLRKMDAKVLLGNLLEEQEKIRHNSARLARLLLDEFFPRAAKK